MRYRRATISTLLVVAFLLALITMTAGTAAAGVDKDLTDAELVFCASGPVRTQFRDAAVALGVATPGDTSDTFALDGRNVTFQEWRAKAAPAFTRTCRGLYVAQRPPGGTPARSTYWTIILPTLTGAFLTLFITSWRDARGRARENATLLRSAGAELNETLRSYVASWTSKRGAPDTTDFFKARSELRVRLRMVAVAHPRWSHPRAALTGLGDDAQLGHQITEQWGGRTDEELRTRRNELERAAEDVLLHVEQTAQALTSVAPLRGR
jgi:hypothetical protein